MTPEQLQKFESLLLSMRRDLESAVARGQDSQSIVELDQQAVGRLSRMDALQNQAMAQASGRQRDVQSARIRSALSRIEDETYGECLDCGEDIPIKRLELDPTAPLCISCASG